MTILVPHKRQHTPILAPVPQQGESEMSGVFVSAQPSDTDLGGKEPKKLLLKGIFYAKVDQQ